jgi:hypothetical protein
MEITKDTHLIKRTERRSAMLLWLFLYLYLVTIFCLVNGYQHPAPYWCHFGFHKPGISPKKKTKKKTRKVVE